MTIAELAAALAVEIKRGNGNLPLFAYVSDHSTIILSTSDFRWDETIKRSNLVVTSYEPHHARPLAT